MLYSEEIKPIALAVIELPLSEGRQAGGRAGGQAAEKSLR